MAYVRQFLGRILKDLVALLSSIASVILTFLAIHFGKQSLPNAWWFLAAAFCLLLATFRVWRKERQEVERLSSKQSAPILTLNYDFSVGPWSNTAQLVASMSQPFTVRNETDFPALSVKVQDVPVADYFAVFDRITGVTRGAPAEVKARLISAKDRKAVQGDWKNAFAALFIDANRERVLQGQEQSNIEIPVEVAYQDSAGREIVSRSTIHCRFEGGWTVKAEFDGFDFVKKLERNWYDAILNHGKSMPTRSS